MCHDRDLLHAYLDTHPNDREARLALADLLEEYGDDREAAVQRWLGENRCWPDADLAFLRIRGWHWWASVSEDHRQREHALLPHAVQRHMPGGEWVYRTRRDAERVLADALIEARLLAVPAVAAR